MHQHHPSYGESLPPDVNCTTTKITNVNIFSLLPHKFSLFAVPTRIWLFHSREELYPPGHPFPTDHNNDITMFHLLECVANLPRIRRVSQKRSYFYLFNYFHSCQTFTSFTVLFLDSHHLPGDFSRRSSSSLIGSWAAPPGGCAPRLTQRRLVSPVPH